MFLCLHFDRLSAQVRVFLCALVRAMARYLGAQFLFVVFSGVVFLQRVVGCSHVFTYALFFCADIVLMTVAILAQAWTPTRMQEVYLVFCIVRTGANWCRLVRTGADWCGLVRTGADWCGLARTGADWCRLVQTGTDWCRLVQTGADWCGLVQTGADWCGLVQTGADWCILVRTGAYWC